MGKGDGPQKGQVSDARQADAVVALGEIQTVVGKLGRGAGLRNRGKDIGPITASHRVTTRAAGDHVGPVTTIQEIIAKVALQAVIAIAAAHSTEDGHLFHAIAGS